MRRLQPKRWRVTPGDPDGEARLQKELGINPVIARLLAQRGITHPEAAEMFLNPGLERMHDPFLLPDALPACERIKTALKNQEGILVHGDYDGDGITSAALWTRTLRGLGGKVDVFVPHRQRNGYDIRLPIIDQAKANNVRLIITTDCGIQRVDEVEHAREHGMDVIITDHHTPRTDGRLPKAVAVVNPHLPGSQYPFPHLAGVGVAFKMCEALTVHLGHKAAHFRRGFLDLACIGTVTDIMPLMGENRIIVKHGLEALRNTNKLGLRALLDESVSPQRPLTAATIGFQIGPRLNSAGRVDESALALQLLLTKDPQESVDIARRLSQLNEERKAVQNQMISEAEEQIAKMDLSETPCLVLSRSSWSGGIVGLVANRLRERLWRPCIVIGINEETGEGRGSARSIEAFNVFNAIDDCKALLHEYGGHAHAAGLSISAANVPAFTAKMNEIARTLLTEEDLMPSIHVAMELGTHEISPKLVAEIEALAPFGHENHEPIFVSRGVPIVDILQMGKEKQHLKLVLRTEGLNDKDTTDALWWWQADLAETFRNLSSVDICYQLEINEFNGARKVQFKLLDIQAPEW